jgi:hypothetical protein
MDMSLIFKSFCVGLICALGIFAGSAKAENNQIRKNQNLTTPSQMKPDTAPKTAKTINKLPPNPCKAGDSACINKLPPDPCKSGSIACAR